MSALPITPLTITPRPTESRRPNSPSQREGAGGWVPIATNNPAPPDQPNADSPSQREGAGGRADLDPPAPLLPSSPAPLPFSPSHQAAAAIIDDFGAQDLTLRDIADKYETTLELLTLWLARPDIARRLSAFESACATRARLVVANNLAAIANKLLHLLDEAKLDHESIHRVPVATPHAFAARMQSRESARKTANLLLRIARFTPLARTGKPASAPPLPAKRGEDRLAKGQAGEGTDAHLDADAVQYTAAAPATPPTRQREVTAPSLPAAPSEIPNPTSDIPNPTSNIPASTSPEREGAGLPRAESPALAHISAAHAATDATHRASPPSDHRRSHLPREPAATPSRAPPKTPA